MRCINSSGWLISQLVFMLKTSLSKMPMVAKSCENASKVTINPRVNFLEIEFMVESCVYIKINIPEKSLFANATSNLLECSEAISAIVQRDCLVASLPRNDGRVTAGTTFVSYQPPRPSVIFAP